MPKYSAKYITPGDPTPEGWTKYGNIAVDVSGIAGFTNQPFTPGISESLDSSGYAIITDTTNAGIVGRPVAGGPATASESIPTFWISPAKTEESFCYLFNRLPARQNLITITAGTAAVAWLNTNGYWTSWSDTFTYDSLTLLSWPSSTTGFTKYTGGVTSIDDGYTNIPITLASSYSMNAQSSNQLYVSTNGYVTLSSGIGNIISTPQQVIGSISGNPSDQWQQSGLVMTDGDTQDIYYKVIDLGGGKSYIKLIVYQGTFGSNTTPKSYLLNIYRDGTYQWVETRVKSNATGNSGPYNISDVSQPSSQQSRVWRGDLNGQNWVYLGTGSISGSI